MYTLLVSNTITRTKVYLNLSSANLYWSKSDPHKIMTPVQATKCLGHSRAILQIARCPEDTYAPVALMRPAITESPLPGSFSSAQDSFGNKSSLISAFSYATTMDHPWSPPLFTPRKRIILDFRIQSCSLTSPYVHNVKRPPSWGVKDWGGIFCMQSQQSNTNNHDHYNKFTHEDHAVTQILRMPRSPHGLQFNINRHSSPVRKKGRWPGGFH